MIIRFQYINTQHPTPVIPTKVEDAPRRAGNQGKTGNIEERKISVKTNNTRHLSFLRKQETRVKKGILKKVNYW